MALNTSVFMHDSDKAALQTLKSIPGFTQLLKGFMNIWNERQLQTASERKADVKVLRYASADL